MKQIAFALVTLPMALLILAALLFGAKPRPASPFQNYGAWMPGQAIPSEADCDSFDIYAPYPMSYVYCELGADRPFKALRLFGRDGLIQTAFFYPVDARLGDLVGWLGEYTRITRGRLAWYVTWPHAQAYTRRSTNRYEAQVVVVWFHENSKGDKR